HINWPLSTIRITSNSRAVISQMASHILDVWKVYDHKEMDIISHTNGVSHQTITPILRKTDHQYVLNLVLRNNRTSSEYPDGIFHPHADVHHIKKENIGLIEAMGLAILPGRLKKELDLIEKYLNHEISYDQSLDKHQDWMSYLAHYDKITKEILFNEVGKKYERVLEDAGVYKLDEKGLEGMNRLINEIIKTSKIS
ncbi:MAG: hypothetical protein JXC31_02995, partial [Acholeplasmataceae bacterium]|nr:hypothetical protein [Acholeplasmataceae bacterium]